MNQFVKETVSNSRDAFVEMVRGEIEKSGKYVGLVPTAFVVTNPEINPRKSTNKADRETLKADIQKRGIDSGLLLRILENDAIEVVAGTTRFGIAEEISLPEIPATIKILSDNEAKLAAGNENIKRSNMTPIEEADWAAERLIALANNKDELMLESGWSQTKLASRLLLRRAVREVREALAQKVIDLGHAQLLVGLAEEAQEGFLQVIISESLTVDAAKQRLEARQRPLSGACFDVSGCAGCSHNTAIYQDLFSTSTKGANCRNGKCWSEKTKSHLEQLVEEKKQEYGTVKLDVDVVKGSTAYVNSSGANGVGDEQVKACVNCEHYGCVVSTIVGQEGKLTKDVCFNVPCNSEKISAYKKSLRSTDKSSIEKKVELIATDGSDKKDKEKNAEHPKQPTKDDLFLAKRIKSYAFDVYGTVSSSESVRSPHVQNVVSIFTLWRDAKKHDSSMWKTLGLKKATDASNDALVFRHLLKATDECLDKIREELTIAWLLKCENPDGFENDSHRQYSLSVLNTMEVDLASKWKVTADYLALLTKAGISVALEDSGYKKAFIEVKGEKEFQSLINSPVKEIPKKIMDFDGFDWTGFLPYGMDYKQYTSKF